MDLAVQIARCCDTPPVAELEDLIKLTQRWGLGQRIDPEQLHAVRSTILDGVSRHAASDIPVYRRLVRELGVDPSDRPLLTCDIYKTYDPAWITAGNWTAMTNWLEQLHDRPLPTPEPVADLDGWLDAMQREGTRIVCSSGSSGMLSFLPRSADEWSLARGIGVPALMPLVARRIGSRAERIGVRIAASMLAPHRLAALIPRGWGASFTLDFSDGPTGNQTVGRELAQSFATRHALYPMSLAATTLHALARGPRSGADVAALASLQSALVDDAPAHLDRLVQELHNSAGKRQRAFVFGTPYQLLRVVQTIEASGRPVASAHGSVVFFGGGWKSFTGEAVDRPDLLARASAALGVAPTHILEGYSMTEMNTVLLRCETGRFHVPPLLEAFLVDDAFRESPTGTGRFGFRDLLARSRPAFLVTGDEVTMVDGECPCGLHGPAVTSIERAARQEVKGCAGLAASLPV